MHYAVLGPLQILTWLEKAPNLHRHLHDSPRKRRKQGLDLPRFGGQFMAFALLSARAYCLSLLPPPSWPPGCGKREAFSKGCGRVPAAGRGRQPSITRQTGGRGDGGPGEEGVFSTSMTSLA